MRTECCVETGCAESAGVREQQVKVGTRKECIHGEKCIQGECILAVAFYEKVDYCRGRLTKILHKLF